MGVLSEYIDCISINHDKLQTMFEADQSAWENNVMQAKDHAD